MWAYTHHICHQRVWCGLKQHICHQIVWCGLIHTLSVTKEFDVDLYTPYLSHQSLMWASTPHISHRRVWCGLIHTISVSPEFDVGIYTPYISPQSTSWSPLSLSDPLLIYESWTDMWIPCTLDTLFYECSFVTQEFDVGL